MAQGGLAMSSSQRTLSMLAAGVLSALFFFSATALGQATATDVQTQTPSTSPTPPKLPTPAPDEAGWHVDLTPYLWFAGAHGTVGVLGRTASVHASPGDLLSHFDIGIMGAAEARYNRFVINGDLFWI